MSFLDQTRLPNLRDLIPPPPMDEPPLCLAAQHPTELPLSPMWHQKQPFCSFHPQPDLFCSLEPCCQPDEFHLDLHHHPHHQMETNFFSSDTSCNPIVEGGTLKKPRVRKLSSPNKRAQVRNRTNKGKAVNSTEDGDVVMKMSANILSYHDRCLSDNDGDDESEALNLLSTPNQGNITFSKLLVAKNISNSQSK